MSAPATVSQVTVHDSVPRVAGASVQLRDDALVWRVGGQDHTLRAGDGIASGIVDLVLGHRSDTSMPVPPAASTSRAPSARPASPTTATPATTAREQPIPVDQTHTSVIVDGRWVVKIVGFWGASNRSAAILDRLQQRQADVCPALVGALHWSHPEWGSTTLALINEYVTDSSDGWTWALNDTLEHLRSGAELRREWPKWPTQLGTLTGRMHQALLLSADEMPDEDPRVRDRVQALDVLDTVFRLIAEPDQSSAFADEGFRARMRSRRAALSQAIASIPEAASGPLLIPHGDYHVGQVLRTASGRYFVLDFDGDPQWDAERRLRPDGAARDVAHMLTSIDLVAAVAQKYLGGADERAWEWGLAAQQQFLEAYRAVVGPDVLDEDRLEGLVAEQLLHELLYAQRFLPQWLYAADGVITRRYVPDHTGISIAAATTATGPGPGPGTTIGTIGTGTTTSGTATTPSSSLDDTEPPWIPPALPVT